MPQKKHTDGVIGLGLFFFSLVMHFLVIPNQTKEISFGAGSLSPAFFPKLASLIIGILSLILVFNNFFLKQQTRIAEFGPKALNIILFLIAYVFGIQLLGYMAATGLFLFALMVYLSREKWIRYVFIILGFLIVNYFFFEKVLNLILPRGILFQ
ncbi:MAG: tripartite tricarboxylate transporter TctB family protein [Desulfohalobiaceae bacterium]|nr:tripartite tricarboxylate transporter TctB family protein [Desulfohalobiaceae bacterium]